MAAGPRLALELPIIWMDPMKIATWNVNSIKARLEHLTRWLDAAKPDIALLQELKCEESSFPAMELKGLGYNAAVSGQKTYNGVAILARGRISDVTAALPGDKSDEQARYIEATVTPEDGKPVRAASVYVPNGGELGSDKYAYKLRFYGRLTEHMERSLAAEQSLVLGGDFNVAPWDIDVHDPKAWRGQVLVSQPERAALRRLLNLGMTDAVRVLHPGPGQYSWWDYRNNAWPRNDGLRIDHLLLSPRAADRLSEAGIDKTPRGWDKASDHTPVWCAVGR